MLSEIVWCVWKRWKFVLVLFLLRLTCYEWMCKQYESIFYVQKQTKRISFIKHLFIEWTGDIERTCWLRFRSMCIRFSISFNVEFIEKQDWQNPFSLVTISDRSTWNSGTIEPRPNHGLSHTNISISIFSGHIWLNENASTCQRNGKKFGLVVTCFLLFGIFFKWFSVSNSITKSGTRAGLLLWFVDYHPNDVGTLFIQSNERYGSIRRSYEC